MHKKYILYGAGRNAETIIKRSRGIFEFDCVIDKDESKWGQKIGGLEIKSPQFLKSQEYKNQDIIISITNEALHESVVNDLYNLGFEYGVKCFDGVDIIPLGEAQPGHVSGVIKGIPTSKKIKSFDVTSFLLHAEDKRRILRCVNDLYVDNYKEVYTKCKENGLFDKYIVNTRIADEKTNLPYKLVLEHEYINPISYCFEWSPKTFRDYTLFMADMLKALAKADMGLCDGHALNATIYKTNFVFIDFGALKCGMTKKNTLIEYINTHLIPLILYSKEQTERAYLFLKNAGLQYTLADIKGYLNDEEVEQIANLYNDVLHVKEQKDVLNFLDKIIKYINEMAEDSFSTKWQGYQNDEWDWSDDKEKWSDKMHNVMQMIESVKADSIVDLAGNMGWYGTYYHSKVNYVVVIDMDTHCVDYVWNRIRQYSLDNVIPIRMSICAPTLDYYRDEAISKTAIIPWRQNAVQRFKSDLVLALAIIHHLVFSQQLSFDEVIDQFLMFSNKYMIIEFVEQTDKYIWNFKREGFEWYTKENFEECLNKRCIILDTKPSTPGETRTLYLCEIVKD